MEVVPVRTVSCPLCGLRYAHSPELDQHVRDDHAPAPEPERQEAIVRAAPRPAAACGPERVMRLPW